MQKPSAQYSRQLACMKLGSREIYQPIQYCWVHTCRLLGYLVHTCHLPRDIQQVSCSTPDRTAFAHAALTLPCLGYCNLYIHSSCQRQLFCIHPSSKHMFTRLTHYQPYWYNNFALWADFAWRHDCLVEIATHRTQQETGLLTKAKK